MVDLDQDRGGGDAPLAHRLGEQLRAALMCVVVAIECADQKPRCRGSARWPGFEDVFAGELAQVATT